MNMSPTIYVQTTIRCRKLHLHFVNRTKDLFLCELSIAFEPHQFVARIVVPQLFTFDHFIIKLLMFTHMEIPIDTMHSWQTNCLSIAVVSNANAL